MTNINIENQVHLFSNKWLSSLLLGGMCILFYASCQTHSPDLPANSNSKTEQKIAEIADWEMRNLVDWDNQTAKSNFCKVSGAYPYFTDSKTVFQKINTDINTLLKQDIQAFKITCKNRHSKNNRSKNSDFNLFWKSKVHFSQQFVSIVLTAATSDLSIQNTRHTITYDLKSGKSQQLIHFFRNNCFQDEIFQHTLIQAIEQDIKRPVNQKEYLLFQNALQKPANIPFFLKSDTITFFFQRENIGLQATVAKSDIYLYLE